MWQAAPRSSVIGILGFVTFISGYIVVFSFGLRNEHGMWQPPGTRKEQCGYLVLFIILAAWIAFLVLAMRS
jgi:membrane-bound ClpP family serine protease